MRFVQRQWKEALARKRQALEKLQTQWTQVLATITEPLAKKKPSRRGKQPPTSSLALYFSISSATRQTILQQYYHDQSRAFLVQIRAYLADRQLGIPTPPPRFTLETSTKTMKKLIEQAVVHSEGLIRED